MFKLRENLFSCGYEHKRAEGRLIFLFVHTLKKISVMHVIKLGFAPVSFPPG